jgi:hypothetical protein
MWIVSRLEVALEPLDPASRASTLITGPARPSPRRSPARPAVKHTTKRPADRPAASSARAHGGAGGPIGGSSSRQPALAASRATFPNAGASGLWPASAAGGPLAGRFRPKDDAQAPDGGTAGSRPAGTGRGVAPERAEGRADNPEPALAIFPDQARSWKRGNSARGPVTQGRGEVSGSKVLVVLVVGEVA